MAAMRVAAFLFVLTVGCSHRETRREAADRERLDRVMARMNSEKIKLARAIARIEPLAHLRGPRAALLAASPAASAHLPEPAGREHAHCGREAPGLSRAGPGVDESGEPRGRDGWARHFQLAGWHQRNLTLQRLQLELILPEWVDERDLRHEMECLASGFDITLRRFDSTFTPVASPWSEVVQVPVSFSVSGDPAEVSEFLNRLDEGARRTVGDGGSVIPGPDGTVLVECRARFLYQEVPSSSPD